MNCCVEVKVEKIHTPKPIRMTKNNYFSEIISAPITRPDSNESIKSLGRCSNPFYKNFENEEENNLK